MDTNVIETIISYLKNRMMIHQDVIASDIKPMISYQEWVMEINRKEQELAKLTRLSNIVINSEEQREVREKKEQLKAEYAQFLNKYENRIQMRREEIDIFLNEIASYLKSDLKEEQMTLEPMGQNYNENEFLRKILSCMESSYSKKKESEGKQQQIKDYKTFFYMSKTMGFEESLMGTFVFGSFPLLEIYNHRGRKIAEVFSSGEIHQEIPFAQENILLAKNLYSGRLPGEGLLKETVFLEVEVKGEKFLRAIDYNYEDYPLEAVTDKKLFNDVLRESGYAVHTKPLYSAEEFYRVLDYYFSIIEGKPEKDRNFFEKLKRRIFH